MALASIYLLYFVIGVVAAFGSITITQTRLSPGGERLFYALLLLPIAAMYFAFSAYFQLPVIRTEAIAIALFAALGLAGIRFPLLAAAGYLLHGAWDLAHELQAFGSVTGADRGWTAIPLAYGIFCAAYDWFIAGYIVRRRQQWIG